MNRTKLLKGLDNLMGPSVCRLSRGKPAQTPPPDITDSLRRLLVIRPGGIGDMLLLVPLLANVLERYPDATLDVVCESRNARVLGLTELNVNTLLYDQYPLRTMKHLKQNRYDVAIDTEQFHNFSAIFTARSQAPVRIGFNINPVRNPIYTTLVSYEVSKAEIDQFHALFKPLIGDTPPVFAGSFHNKPHGGEQESPYALIHAGGSTPDKHWPTSSFQAVTDHLTSRGLEIVMTGDDSDTARARAIAGKTRATIRNLTGSRDLAQTAALCANAKLFIGPDSGLAHLAVAYGVPTVTLFGSSDPGKWGHNNVANYRAVRIPLACSPCAIFGYTKPCRHFSCIRGISPADVLRAIDAVLT